MIGWNFPSNGFGQRRGIAEAGIQTFTGKEISSLAREICQNSLDAAIDENSIVTVEFQRHEIKSSDIPARDEYKKILRQCRDSWAGNDKTETFFNTAIFRIDRPTIFVLRISDFNTTGLENPFDPRALDGWNALTKIDGGATKIGDAAGSFGIGKNAPFTNSALRLIFYRTLNLNGERAAQGVSRVVSFAIGNDEYSAGIGYFGETNKNLPVTSIAALDKICRRDSCGTDVFVYGFNGGKDWQEKISVKLIENFLVAIHRGKFSAKIQGDVLSRDTLENFIDKYAADFDKAADYYKVLTGDDVKIFNDNFHDMGTLKLRVIVDSRTKLNRRVLIIRKNGMKLFDMDRISGTLSFTGILELEGRALNEFFRQMETPAHDKWEPGRHEKPALAREYVTELKRWVREKILSLTTENISEEVDVEGLGEMLAFDDSAIDGTNETLQETLELQTFSDDSPQELLPSVEKISNDLMTTGGNDNSQTQRTAGDITADGQDNAARKLSGTRRRRTLAEHRGTKNPDGNNIVLEPVGQKISCKKIRVIKVGDKNYRLILGLPQNVSAGKIEIFAVGEDGSLEKIFITRASSADSKIQILTVGDKIAFKNLRGTTEAKINFELRDKQNYALEVDVSEN